MAGIKNDTGKVDLSLVPMVAVVRLAEAMTVGLRYGRYNYCEGMEASRVMGALLRHAFKWFNGEDFDPDGQHHLGSVMACCAMILRQEELGTLVDNRFKPKPPTASPFWYQVIGRGTHSTKRFTLGVYDDKTIAERMITNFYSKQWEPSSFILEIQEVLRDDQPQAAS